MMTRIVLLLIGVATYTFGKAQEISTLTLKEAVDICLDNNVTLKTERNNLVTAQAQSLSSKATFLPRVNGRFTVGQTNGNQFIQQTAEVINGTVTWASGGLDANVILFNGFSNLNNYKSANSNLKAQQFNLKQTEQNLINQVVAQYLRAFLNVQLLEIAEENHQFQKQSWNRVKELVEVGSLAYIDQANQEALMKSAELDMVRAQANLRNSKAQLALLLLINPEDQFTVEEPSLSDLPNELPELAALIDEAKQYRNDLKWLNETEQSAYFSAKSQLGNMIPTISAFGSWASRYNNNVDRTFEQQFLTDWRSITYGVSLNIPILNGMNNRMNYVRSNIQYENAKLQRLNREKVVRNEVLIAYQNYLDALKTLEMATAQMESAEEAYKLNKDSFELGLINVIDFSQANRDYFNAKSSLLNAKVSLYFQDLLVRSAVGTISAEDL